jgi:succinoglycan biosynthesis transport protein ExoP
MRRLPSIMRYALDNPLSPFAETLRAGKIAVDLTLRNRSPKLIGIVSALPGEGKSTIAMNLATLLSHAGYRTLLIDGDLRNPGLTRAVAPFAEHGLVEAVMDSKPISEVMVYEPDSSLALLPAVIQGRVPHTSEFLASPGMRAVLQQAVDANYAFVLLDLPPLAPVVDARAIMPLLDGVLLVVEWGKTTRALVRSALLSSGVGDKCIGVLLNKVALKKLKLYENYGPDGYYSGKNSKYYFPKTG